ncbi:MAG: helix-turn-helix transcriptional regulator [Clostridia bacterium]|nr:helix-turn-helix transcriptional regulator [Clostridia bacterium]
MTVGEKIQMYRKQLDLSQEELGQKLLVSRQTISLWEKDQTVPTIDNLIRLREIFGVSVDEILGFENIEQNDEILPNESYRFTFSKQELNEIYRLQRKSIYKRPIIFTVLCILMIVFFIGSSAPDVMIGFSFGMFLIGAVSHIKGIRAYSKAWKNSTERICKSVYEYKVFENYISVNIYRENEKIRESKCFFTDIEQIQQFGKWLFLQFGGQSFIIRKSDLKENSAFYSYMYKNPSRITEKPMNNKWKVLSVILFVASLLSIFGALGLVAMVSSKNHLFVENMWLFFLLTPIPIASIVLGFVLKLKNYKYKKNIIVGIIMVALLCIYGSFSFIFANVYDHSEESIVRAEQTIGINIPEHKQISTQDWTKGTQSVSRGYIYYTSDIYFENSAVADFEKQLAKDNKWLSSVSNDLIGITSPMNDYGFYDYVLVYNVDTAEYNTLPNGSGKYRFINILYRLEENQMKIVEYDIDYVK